VLTIKVIMNSDMEALFAFKCCTPADMNLEIQLRNTGQEPIVVPSRCDLEGPRETKRIPNLFPHGGLTIPPGQIAAFYCTMDEDMLARYEHISFQDSQGRTHTAALR
jgi:hypothetical protein